MQKNNQEYMENMRKRIENIENLVKSIEDNVIYHKAKDQQEQMTAKMREALKVIELSGEISYDNLAAKLDISVSSLRGLLSIIARRTDKIKRFEKDTKGWVSFVMNSDSKRFEIDEKGKNELNQAAVNPQNAKDAENKL